VISCQCSVISPKLQIEAASLSLPPL